MKERLLEELTNRIIAEDITVELSDEGMLKVDILDTDENVWCYTREDFYELVMANGIFVLVNEIVDGYRLEIMNRYFK